MPPEKFEIVACQSYDFMRFGDSVTENKLLMIINLDGASLKVLIYCYMTENINNSGRQKRKKQKIKQLKYDIILLLYRQVSCDSRLKFLTLIPSSQKLLRSLLPT